MGVAVRVAGGAATGVAGGTVARVAGGAATGVAGGTAAGIAGSRAGGIASLSKVKLSQSCRVIVIISFTSIRAAISFLSVHL